MKKFISYLPLLLLLSVLVPSNSSAQCGFDFVTIAQGESPIASGLDIGVYGSCGENVVVGSFGSTKAYGLYQWNDFGVKGLSFSGSAGFFSGVPWIGPRVTYQPHKYITFIGWGAVSAGNPVAEILAPRIEIGFLQADIQFPVSKYFTPGFSYLQFGGDLYLPYVNDMVPISNSLEGFWSVTYDVTNEMPLFFIGMKISLPWKN